LALRTLAGQNGRGYRPGAAAGGPWSIAAGVALKRRSTIGECSIAELLDDPIAHMLMKSDGVDRQALESLLTDQLARFADFDNGDRLPPRDPVEIWNGGKPVRSIPMALRNVYVPVLPEMDAFLFASVGEEEKGIPLSVLSALARLGLDPRNEAARLSHPVSYKNLTQPTNREV
jgi:hypothetical protein